MATATTPTEPALDQVPPVEAEPTSVETPAEGAAPSDGGAPAPVAEVEGSRPGESPSTEPPATGTEDPDVSFAFSKHADPKDLARDWTRLNNLVGPLQKDREELERLRAVAQGKPLADTEPARVERAPSTDQLKADLEKRTNEYVASDRYANSWRAEYREKLPKAKELGVFDERYNRFVSGAIFDLDSKIARIKANIESSETPIPGLPSLGWGEFELGEAKRELRSLEFDRRAAYSDWREMNGRLRELADLYDARFDQVKDHLGKQLDAETSQRDEQAQVVQIANDFEKEQKTAFGKVCDELQIKKDPTTRADLERRFKFHFMATRLVPGHENPTMSPQETEAAVRDFISGERKYAGHFTEQAVREYSEAKKADSRPAAPKGKAAIVPATPEDPEAWKRRWEEEKAQPVLDRIAKRRGR